MLGKRRVIINNEPLFDKAFLKDDKIDLYNKNILVLTKYDSEFIKKLRNYINYDTLLVYHQYYYKTSKISGNEWRTSLVFVLNGKEIEIDIEDFNDETAFYDLIYTLLDDSIIFNDNYKNYCDQTGCSVRIDGNNPRSVYKLTKGFSNSKRDSKEIDLYKDSNLIPVRVFCPLHNIRGDNNLSDCDDIYSSLENTKTDTVSMKKYITKAKLIYL